MLESLIRIQKENFEKPLYRRCDSTALLTAAFMAVMGTVSAPEIGGYLFGVPIMRYHKDYSTLGSILPPPILR